MLFAVLLCFAIVLLIRYKRNRRIEKKKECDAYNAEKHWHACVRSIPMPPSEKCVWSPNYSHCKLTLVMVEFREHEWFEGVMNNYAHVYGGDPEVALVVIHGHDNASFVRQKLSQWKNVKFINLHYPAQMTLETYNDILTEPAFWDHFESEFVLIFQTDTLMRKRIPNHFFAFDYVGAPWSWMIDAHGKMVDVGNGGLSLRRVAAMKEICLRYSRGQLYEDVFFSRYASRVPSKDLAMKFSVETVFYEDPCGMHKPYNYLSVDQIRELLKSFNVSCSLYNYY